MRIIDANRLKRSFEANTPLAFQDCVPGIHAIIDLEPTVDAVPIVRCKDCKFRDSELACTQFDVYTSAAGDLFSPPDWFYCGYGKRKEE